MKHILKLLSLIALLCLQFHTFGQTEGTGVSETSGQTDAAYSLPSLSEQYFEDAYTLDRSYEYQLFNKKRRLKMWAVNTATISIALMIGGGVGTVELTTAYNWKEAIAIPCGVVISMTPFIAGLFLMRYLWKRADAIDVSALTHVPLNNKVSLGLQAMAFQHTTSCSNYQSAGFGITLNF